MIPEQVARLHLSESAYGASPAALAAAHAALSEISIYPDASRQQLTEALAQHYQVGTDQVAVANGSDELVLLTSLALGVVSRAGVTTASTFPGYRTCLVMTGRGCREVPLRHLRIDIPAFQRAMPQAGIAYVCNPHNPSGDQLRAGELAALVETAGASGVPLVIDEAYQEFAPADAPRLGDYLADDLPLISLRTFSKAFGLAALRIGFAIGSRTLIRQLTAMQGTMPFSANRIGQAAARAALSVPGFIDDVRARNAERRDWFCGQVAARGRVSLPSATNFVAIASAESEMVARRLAAEHQILVRDAAAFGFPGFLRVSMGRRAELTRFLDALDLIDPVPAPGQLAPAVLRSRPVPARAD